MVLQNYQSFIAMTSNRIYIVVLGVGLKCPPKIYLNTQCPPPICLTSSPAQSQPSCPLLCCRWAFFLMGFTQPNKTIIKLQVRWNSSKVGWDHSLNTQFCINRSSMRKRGMTSSPLFITLDFLLHFSSELSYSYLGNHS